MYYVLYILYIIYYVIYYIICYIILYYILYYKLYYIIIYITKYYILLSILLYKIYVLNEHGGAINVIIPRWVIGQRSLIKLIKIDKGCFTKEDVVMDHAKSSAPKPIHRPHLHHCS